MIPVQKVTPKERQWSPREIQDIQFCINTFLESGALSEVRPCQDHFLSNIFLTPKSDGSYRLILNLKKT